MATIEFSLNAHIAGFVAGMKAAKEAMRDFIGSSGTKTPFEKINTDVKNVSAAFSKMQGQAMGGDLFGAVATASNLSKSIIPEMGAVGIAIASIGIAATGAAGAMYGMWNAMSRSKEITAMAEASGMTIVQFMGLEQAFHRAGLALDEAPPLISHFTEALMSLGDPMSKATYAFAQLGLNANDFNGRTNAESLDIFAKALDRTTDKTKKLLAANAAFSERRGGRMIQALQGGALQESMQNVSPVSGVFERSGEAFNKFQSSIEKLLGTFMTFFAGMAEVFVENFGGIIEKISKIDLSEDGRTFAQYIVTAFELAKPIFSFLKFIFDELLVVLNTVMLIMSPWAAIVDAFRTAVLGEKTVFTSSEFSGGSKGTFETPSSPDIGKLDIKFSPMEVIHPIVDSLTRIGGGGGSAVNSVDIQRDQLDVLRRISDSVSNFSRNINADLTPKLPTIYGSGGSVGTW